MLLLSDNDVDSEDVNSDEELTSQDFQTNQKNAKRKHEDQHQSRKKTKTDPSKKSNKNEPYKPPTAEELNRLRETETLFNSNIFRLQIEELLAEVKIKQKFTRKFASWYEHFETFIKKINEYGDIQQSDIKLVRDKRNNLSERQKFINRLVNFHYNCVKCDQDCTMKFVKPESCNTLGLYKINSTIGKYLEVKIFITMPKSCFLEKDYLNNRYLVKRNYYLSYIAHELSKSKLHSLLSYTYVNGNPLLPILHVVPTLKKTLVNIYVVPNASTFKLSRFEASKNNLKTQTFDGFDDITTQTLKTSATPLYNTTILHDLTIVSFYELMETVLRDFNNIQDAIKLLLVWIKQRGLNVGLAGFTNDLVTATVLYLTAKKKINNAMSSYQIIRGFWLFLSTSDWCKEPISICENVKESNMKQFQNHFDIVFLDNSGYYNLAAYLNREVYFKIRKEAELAVKYLDAGNRNSFGDLFMTSLPHEVQYDAILTLTDTKDFKDVYDSIDDQEKLTLIGHYEILIVGKITNVLKQALNKRALHVVPLYQEEVPWVVGKKHANSFSKIVFGIKLDPDHAFKVLEIGPSATDPSCEAFRKFWGNLAELRRFQDGSANEAVYFAANTIQEKRQIFKKIINHVVTNNLKIENYHIFCDELEATLVNEDLIPPFPVGTNEEATLTVINAYDQLTSILRNLKLPLEISAIQGLSDIFSYTAVFPPIPTNYRSGKKITTSTETNVLLKEDTVIGMVPRFVEPIESVIQLSMHSKWPHNLEAIRHIKLAFYLNIAELLQTEQNIKSNVKPDHLDVFYQGLVYRFFIYHPKEMSFLKRNVGADGVTAFKDTVESSEYEKNLNIMPKICGALNGLQSQHTSFGPSTALIKRWLRSQMIDRFHFPDVVINLLNASIYLDNDSFDAVNLPQVGFLRFLKYCAEADWNINLVVVNFNDEFNREQLDSLESSFQQNRQNHPNLCIITPYDDGKSIFSKTCTKEILRRISTLCRITHNIIKNCINAENITTLKQLFVPNLSGYNVIIHLRPLLNSKRHQEFSLAGRESKILLEEFNEKESSRIPVVGFNPVDIYLKELRQFYGEFAHFFHNSYGGNVIAILWKPNVFETHDFKVSAVNGKKVVDDKLTLNIDAIIEDFYILGNNLVKNIVKQ